MPLPMRAKAKVGPKVDLAQPRRYKAKKIGDHCLFPPTSVVGCDERLGLILLFSPNLNKVKQAGAWSLQALGHRKFYQACVAKGSS